MSLLNYTTKVPAERTLYEVSAILAKKGATEIMTTYGPGGKPTGLRWRVNTKHGPTSFAMPVNVDAIYAIMTKQRVLVRDDDARREQALRTAWRIIKSWVEAQMALLETEMVELEEIFLPYMLSGDRTLYQALQAGQFKALQAGE